MEIHNGKNILGGQIMLCATFKICRQSLTHRYMSVNIYKYILDENFITQFII